MHRIDPTLDVSQQAILPLPRVLLSNPWRLLKAAYGIHTYVKKTKPDIVQILAEPYAIALPFIYTRHPYRWVMLACGTYTILPLHIKMIGWLMRRAYQKLDHVLAISHYTQQRLIREIQKTHPHLASAVAKKITVFRLGIEDVNSVTPDKKLGVKNILFVGEVKPRKGVLEILKACAAFHEKSSTPFHLHIVGSCAENAYTHSLKIYVREHDLGVCVTFYGHTPSETLARLYSEADLFMMLSQPHDDHFEGFGLVFLEANARGVPVIGPNNSGCIDAVEDNVSGYSVDPLKPADVAERMQWILEEERIHPDDCRQWANAHSIDQMTRHIEHVYQNVI